MTRSPAPRVSIVLPTYNRVEDLKVAIGSVVAQDFRDWELIVVDDGSTDATPVFLKELQSVLGAKLQVIVSQNGGASAARNQGIARAAGDIVAFLDSDDFWLPQKLGFQVEILDRRPDCGFSFTDYSALNEAGEMQMERHEIPATLKDCIYPEVLELRSNFITTPSTIVRRNQLLAAGPFDREMKICEDIDLWRRLSRRSLCATVHLPLTCVKIRKSSEFPYRESARGRFRLYQKAIEEDGMLPAAYCTVLFRELFDTFRSVAVSAKDTRRIQIFDRLLSRLDKARETIKRDSTLREMDKLLKSL